MRQTTIHAALMAAIAALGLAGTAWAKQDTSSDNEAIEPPPQQGPNTSEPGSQIETGNLLQSAAEINATEIALGRIAEQKSGNPEIRKIGQGLVRDHIAANQQVSRLAGSKGVTITAQPTATQQRMIDSLSEASGERLNRQFLRQTQISQERALSFFERASRRARDPEIRKWAGKTVPVVQEHLAMLRGSRPVVAE